MAPVVSLHNAHRPLAGLLGVDGKDMAGSTIADLQLRLEVSGDVIKCALGGPDGWQLAEAASSRELLHYLTSEAAAGLSIDSISESRNFGRLLAKAAFPDPIGHELCSQLRRGSVRLGFDVSPELASIPWEYAHIEQDGIGAIALHPGIRLYRVSSGAPVKSAALDSRSVLVTLSDPQSPAYPRLASCEAEFKSVLSALQAPECRQLKADSLEHATPKSLIQTLEGKRFGVFHFIGHGDVKPSGGALVLEGSRARQECLLYADELARALLASGTQLVVLSSCVSAGSTTSLGSQLADFGVPAVVGMQVPVPDVDAHLFARAFYSALVAGHSVGEAVYEGRMAIRGSGLGWGAPVLTTADPEMKVFAGPPSSVPLRGNLPKPLTSFVGRAAEIADGVKKLETERLVILHGSGGIGKTRLSIEIGRAAGVNFQHGVWQVPLDAVTDPAQVIPAIASAFGIRDSSEKPVEDRLFDFLSDQELLIVLDNCEHLTVACREAAVRILQSSTKVSILATSREVLGTGVDCVVRVSPLSYPEIPEDDEPVFAVEETVRDYEAIQLLVIRAKSADSKFAATDANILDLCRIAKRLDGIPLALELAASRVRSFTPHQIMEKLMKDLAWLDLENPGAVPRHKTLRAALDWSYRMLSEKERTLFNRLGAFPATFLLQAAEHVAGYEAVGTGEVPALLSDLVDKSLVVVEQSFAEMRYRLLDTCRAFALDNLMKFDDLQEARCRHLEVTGSIVKDLWKSAKEGQFDRWKSSMVLEAANVDIALDWGFGEGRRAVVASELTLDSLYFWFMIGCERKAKHFLDLALTALGETDEVLRIKLLLELGQLDAVAGDSARFPDMKEAFSLVKEKHPDLFRFAAPRLGYAAYVLGEDTMALETYELLLSRITKTDDLRAAGSVPIKLSYLHIHRGHYDKAKELLLACVREPGVVDVVVEGVACCLLAHLKARIKESGCDELYCRGMSLLIPLEDYADLPDALRLASSVFLPHDAKIAAGLQGFARRLAEDSGQTSERFIKDWGIEVERETRVLLPDYDRVVREAWTMSAEEALGKFSSHRAVHQV